MLFMKCLVFLQLMFLHGEYMMMMSHFSVTGLFPVYIIIISLMTLTFSCYIHRIFLLLSSCFVFAFDCVAQITNTHRKINKRFAFISLKSTHTRQSLYHANILGGLVLQFNQKKDETVSLKNHWTNSDILLDKWSFYTRTLFHRLTSTLFSNRVNKKGSCDLSIFNFNFIYLGLRTLSKHCIDYITTKGPRWHGSNTLASTSYILRSEFQTRPDLKWESS